MRLNKEDLVKMLLDYQGNFGNILDKLKNELNELKTKFCKLESDLHISRNVNDKPSRKLVVLEQKCHANKKDSRRKCPEILSIPAKVGDKDIEKECWRFWIQSTPLLTRIWRRSSLAIH